MAVFELGSTCAQKAAVVSSRATSQSCTYQVLVPRHKLVETAVGKVAVTAGFPYEYTDVPASPSRLSSTSQVDSKATGSATTAGLSFNRRVHVVAEVLERPEELDLLQQVCDSMEWPVREPLAGQAAVTADAGSTLRVIEVRIRGARETAVEQAVAMLDTLIQNAELSVHCRDATLVERNRKSLVEWRLRGRQGSVSQRLHNALHIAYRTGDHAPHTGTVRLVRVPATLDESRQRLLARTRRTARAVLTHHPLAARQLNPDVHELGRPSVSRRGYVLAFLMFMVVLAAICSLGSGHWSAIGADSPRVGGPLVVLIGGYLLGGAVLAIRRTPLSRTSLPG